MQAIRVAKVGGIDALELKTIDIPKIAAGHVLVRNKYDLANELIDTRKCRFSGVNFIDVYHRTGAYQLPLPFTPGRFAQQMTSIETRIM